jgi:hypothetical protein
MKTRSDSPGGESSPGESSRGESSRRGRAIILAAAMGLSGVVHAPVLAQNTPGTHQDNSGLNGSLSREDLEKLGGDHPQDTSAGSAQDAIRARAKAKAESGKLVNELQLSCEVSDAQLVVAGTRRPASGGKAVETRVYEVACSGGTGYLLEVQGSEKPIGISCLSAEETRAADVAKGREPGFFCKLPGNKDVYAMVSSLIATGTGAPCTVSNLQWFGRGESTQSEYTEVVCKEASGFLLRIAQPGSQAKTVVMTCADAAKQGIKCKLTDPGPVEAPVTMQTFKEALAHFGVTCNISQIRLIGQEDHLKRYAVEYLCADEANGRVALIPLPGNSNPYESLDCATALSDRGVTCALVANRP